MKKIFLSMVAVVMVNFLFAQKPAIITSTKPGWHKITETVVDLKTERKEIDVIGADRFSSIKFRVFEAPLELDSFYVYFEDDSKQAVRLNNIIKPNDQSKIVKLTGDKAIKTIALVYKTASNAGEKKSTVEVWGYKGKAPKDKKGYNLPVH